MSLTDPETVANISLPLCVDLDGTLIQTDSLWESCLRLISQSPHLLFLLPFWLLLGKAGFKHKISQHVQLDPASLPFNTALLKYLTQQRLRNRHLVLITAASEKIANTVAHHLNIFDEVFSSDDKHNLSGSNKASRLVERFGEKGFVYAGNATVDLKVWQHAAAAIVVNAKDELVEKTKQLTPIEKMLPNVHPLSLKTILKAIRIHQWSKNILIFAALILAHHWSDTNSLQSAVFAFFSFSFSASAVYLLNDLLDLEADRTHTTKKFRPLASGAMPVQWGILLIPFLLFLSFVLAFKVTMGFVHILLIYLVLTTTYSLFLKAIALVDVITLTSLYTIRIVAGAIAVTVPISYWLLAFSMFIFLSLALIKRFAELKNLSQHSETKTTSRGYTVKDLQVVSLFGISSGYISIMVLVLYINDLRAGTQYAHPDWLWFVAVAILYWISHMWLLAFRGEMNEDPILFSIHDRASYVVSLFVILSLFLAL